MNIDISFVTINFNSSDYTKELINSIEKHTTPKYEIIVVDNDSQADDSNAIKSFCKDKEKIHFIQNSENCGFACGNMLGAKEAKGEFIFFINNDTKLLNDVSKILADALNAKKEIALATAEIVDENNHIASSYKLFPSLTKELFGNSVARIFNKFPSNKAKLQTPSQVEVISGSCMFFKREIFLEVGGFDTHFFLYCEEEDLSKRVINSGYNVMFIPDAKIYHKGGGSCSSNYNLIKEYYISYTYLIFKHFNILTAVLLYFLVITKLFRRSFTKKNGVKLFMQALKGFREKDSMRYSQ